MRRPVTIAALVGVLLLAPSAAAADPKAPGQKTCEKAGGTYVVPEFGTGYQCWNATVDGHDLKKASRECAAVGGTFLPPSPELKPTYACVVPV